MTLTEAHAGLFQEGDKRSSPFTIALMTDIVLCLRTAVSQEFETDSDKEYVIVGNSGVLRCEVPSFVADYITVQSWVDSDGATYFPSDDYGNSLSV